MKPVRFGNNKSEQNKLPTFTPYKRLDDPR